MLIEFTVGNFRSFAEPVTLSMEATKLKSQSSEVDERNVFDAGKNLRLLRTAAIYGANASGKSNLLKALQFMLDFVKKSSAGTEATGGIKSEPFLLRSDSREAPSTFELVFLMPDSMRVEYGFSATCERVVSEWLYTYPKGRKRQLLRRDDKDELIGRSFPEARRVKGLVRPNSLFLTVAAQYNGSTAQSILKQLESFVVLDMTSAEFLPTIAKYTGLMREMFTETNRMVALLVQELDVGVQDFRFELTSDDSMPVQESASLDRILRETVGGWRSDRMRVRTRHTLYDAQDAPVGDIELDLEENESTGTQKLFGMAYRLIQALVEGETLLIDELDSSLHPMLVRQLLELFQDSGANARNAQLIFTTHDTTVLDKDLLRRDQIWFVEKNRYGASDLYSLAEYKVRNDATFDRDYLRGRYGAIPFIGNLANAFEQSE